MIAGGQDTTATLIANAIGALLSHPEQLEHIRAGRADWADAAAETMRMHTPGPTRRCGSRWRTSTWTGC